MSQPPQLSNNNITATLAQAIAVRREALVRNPDDVEALTALAKLFMQARKWGRAAPIYQRVLELAPEREDARQDAARIAGAFEAAGATHLGKGQTNKAIDAFQRAINLNPECPVQSYLRLGGLLHQSKQSERAIAVLRQACKRHPQSAAAYVNLGQILEELKKTNDAIAAYRRAIEVKPEGATPHRYLAELFIKEGRLEEALDLCQRIRVLIPDDPSVIANIANVLELQGQPCEAYELLIPLVRAGKITTHLALAFGTVCQRLNPPSEEALPLLQLELANPELPVDVRAKVLRTLAALCDTLGRADEAFAYLEQAKEIDASRFEDSKEELLAVIDRSQTCFTKERMACLPRAGHGSDLPLFIVGMPRSGTSLVEQILSSHPRVFGAGELTAIIGLARTALGTSKGYPECFEDWTQGRIDRAANYYLKHLRSLSPAADRVTDKMPFNFLHLGMIEALFPKAKVIHCSRNPLDTCVSCYFMDFSPKLSIFNDLTTIGRYYRGYLELMQHWRRVVTIPLFELRYEELLSDPERVVRALVDFCGLEWNDACMKFHESKRHVKTFSYHQVRKPLYTQSVGRYQAYEKHLGRLKEALGVKLLEEAQLQP